MGLIPKYRKGEFVIFPESIAGSDSIVQIHSRKLILSSAGVDWNYYGNAYQLSEDPIRLKYKTTVTARENAFNSLESRIRMPSSFMADIISVGKAS